MIARWPGRIEAGTESDHISGFQDFLPTACQVAGVEMPAESDGLSYLPELLGEEQQGHEYLYWEFHERDAKQAIRMGRWKAVRTVITDTIELYDLERDLGETNDIAEEYPDVVAQVREYLAGARTDNPHWTL
jgi:arylsulfatase A-like enzyme